MNILLIIFSFSLSSSSLTLSDGFLSSGSCSPGSRSGLCSLPDLSPTLSMETRSFSPSAPH